MRDSRNMVAVIEAPPTPTPAHAPPPPRPRTGAGRRLSVAGLVVAVLLIATVVVYMFAPMADSPSAFFPSPTPAPLASERSPRPSATPFPMTLQQQAQVAYVNHMIASMSLDDEIGQMIMIGFSEQQMDAPLAYEIQHFHVGSAIIYAFNIKDATQLKQLTGDMQGDASLPLLIATDQEGGSVNRLEALEGPTPSAADIGATNNPSVARQRGVQDAQALAQLGINLNLAPVVDVLNTSGGDVVSRSFGSTPARVTKMAGAYLQGLQSTGKVAGTLKHFPGLGDVPVDPHATLYTLSRSRSQLESIDWAPYRALIATGQVQAVMSTHVVLGAIDPTRPASLSKPALTGILRDELGFNGVLITDGIYMHALANYSLDQIAVDAVDAGNDIICSTYSIESIQQVVDAITAAVADGTLTRSRIDDSVRRILLLKLRLGLLKGPHLMQTTPSR